MSLEILNQFQLYYDTYLTAIISDLDIAAMVENGRYKKQYKIDAAGRKEE